MMLLDCMMKDDYSKLKERAGHVLKGAIWMYKPAQEGREKRGRRIIDVPLWICNWCIKDHTYLLTHLPSEHSSVI